MGSDPTPVVTKCNGRRKKERTQEKRRLQIIKQIDVFPVSPPVLGAHEMQPAADRRLGC